MELAMALPRFQERESVSVSRWRRRYVVFVIKVVA
jgi:hypothetical protein